MNEMASRILTAPADDLGDVAELAGTGLADLGPQVLVIGGAGVGLVLLFVAYRMVTTAIRSKGKTVG